MKDQPDCVLTYTVSWVGCGVSFLLFSEKSVPLLSMLLDWNFN